MSRSLILDAEALSALGLGRGSRFRMVRAALEAARRLHRDVVTPAVILAELYRGRGHNQTVDACLSREAWIRVRNTDRHLARYVGAVLAAAGADSDDLADAHVIAAAIEDGGGVVLTGDVADLERLAAAYPQVQVTSI